MNLREQLNPVWDQICRCTNVEGYVGTDMQNCLEENIRPLLPREIGYTFYWNFSGDAKHIFYEIDNPENKLVL